MRPIKSGIDIPFTLFMILSGMVISNILFPAALFFSQKDMLYVIGNPKPLYVYDIHPSCEDKTRIESSLIYMHDVTDINFIQLPYPSALVVGGISYDCTAAIKTIGAVGEAETRIAGAGFFIIAWNQIRLSSIDRTAIVHETLHVMGFDHSDNLNSIMYKSPIRDTIEESLIHKIKQIYSDNVLLYFNVLPINFIYVIIIMVLLLKR